MGLIRLLLIVLLIWVAWRLLRQALLPGPDKQQKDGGDKPGQSPTRMVKCAQCGVHLPEQEAVHTHDLYFCGEEHLLEWKQRNQDD